MTAGKFPLNLPQSVISRSIRLDLASAFAASGAKALAYAMLSRILLVGGTHAADLAMFTLIRSTLGLVNYATLGIAPAFIRQMAMTASGKGADRERMDRLYASAQYPALGICVIALLLLLIYWQQFSHIHVVPVELLRYAPTAALLVGLAMLFRLISDIPGGYLQANHHIAVDNALMLSADVAWPILTLVLLHFTPTPLSAGSLALCICYFVLALARFMAAAIAGARVTAPPSAVDRSMALHLLGFGAMLTLSQLSDFLYAPTDFLLINWFIGPHRLSDAIADYSVAVQLDAALLLFASAVSAVLYPRASHAIAQHDFAAVRRFYTFGTVLTFAMLAIAATLLIIFSKPLLLAWLNVDRPGARAILPLLMIHTVVGGSGAASRAVLLAAGKARAFAASAVVAGVLNAVISYILIRHTTLGLTGVIIGTITAVTLRAGIFLPWYTLRTLRTLRTLQSHGDLPPGPVEPDEPPIISSPT